MNRPFWTPARQPEPDACDSVDPLISLYADGMASADESRRVQAHLPNCESCRESLLWMQATRRALSSRPVAEPPANLQAQIAQALAAAPATLNARPARVFILRPAYAAAASLSLIGLLVGYGLLHHQTPPTTRTSPKSPLMAALPHTNIDKPRVMLPSVLPEKHPLRPVITVKTGKSVPPVDEVVATNRPDENSDALPSVEPQAHMGTAPSRSLTPKPVNKTNLLVKTPGRPVLYKKPIGITHNPTLATIKKPEPSMIAPHVGHPNGSPAENVATNPGVPTLTAPNVAAPPPTSEHSPTQVAFQPPSGEPHTKTIGLLSAVQEYARQQQMGIGRDVSLAGRTAIRAGARSAAMTTSMDSPEAKINMVYTP